MRCDRQVRLAQYRASDGKGINGVGLAPFAARSTRLGHQLRWHPHHLLPCAEHVALHARGQVPAVLDSPTKQVPELSSRPPQRALVPRRGRFDGLLTELAAYLVDCDERVSGLVDIRTDDDHHGNRLLPTSEWDRLGRSADKPQSGAMPRSYQVTPAGPSHPMSAKRMNANPKAASRLRARHQMIRIQPPRSGTVTLTLTQMLSAACDAGSRR